MKNSGKNLRFWFDSIERPVESADYDVTFSEIDVTDSSTPSPSTDTVVSRAKRSSKITANLYTQDGAEISSGSLVVGKRYRVTAKDTELSAYEVGEIFEATSPLVMSTTDKVVPLGSVITGLTMSCSINSVQTPVTSLKFSEAFGEFDATDSSTSGDATEFITGRAKRTTSIELIQQKDVADALISNPQPVPVVLTFNTGLTISGNAIFVKKSAIANSAGDMVKVTYSLNWNGAVNNQLFGLLETETQKPAKIIWAKGSTTNKQVSGNLMVMSYDIEVSESSAAKITYSCNWVGTVTESVAN